MSRTFSLCVYAATTAFFLCFFVMPIWSTVQVAFQSSRGGLTMDYVWEVFRNPLYREGLWNSLVMAVCTTLGCLVIAVPLAFLFTKYRFPGKTLLNSLVLAKMMKLGLFNRDLAFEIAPGVGAFPGPSEEMYYYGISLGGVHGTWMSALSPDMDRYGLDVPAVNFSCLLQRSTQFSTFELVIHAIGINDPMQFALFVGLLNELWVSAEPAGYEHWVLAFLEHSLGPS